MFIASTVSDTTLVFPIERTKIPTVFPIEQAVAKLEYDTRHWPMVYNDTLVFTLKQKGCDELKSTVLFGTAQYYVARRGQLDHELDPLPDLIRRETLTETEVEECKRVIVNLQSREAANEPLSVPSSGGRSKGVKRDEQYCSLWTEFENLTQVYCKNSDRHQTLLSFLQDVMSQCASVQVARKIPSATNNSKEGQQVSSGSTSKVDLAWQELDRYKQMTERETRELDHERQPFNPATNQTPPTMRPLPVPAKPVATLLSMWTAKEHHKASTSHVEFAGRRNFGERAELYIFMKNNASVVVPVDQET